MAFLSRVSLWFNASRPGRMAGSALQRRRQRPGATQRALVGCIDRDCAGANAVVGTRWSSDHVARPFAPCRYLGAGLAVGDESGKFPGVGGGVPVNRGAAVCGLCRAGVPGCVCLRLDAAAVGNTGASAGHLGFSSLGWGAYHAGLYCDYGGGLGGCGLLGLPGPRLGPAGALLFRFYAWVCLALCGRRGGSIGTGAGRGGGGLVHGLGLAVGHGGFWRVLYLSHSGRTVGAG